MNKLLLTTVLLLQCAIMGCTKNNTVKIEDNEDDGLYVFSSDQNNVMSCYVDGLAWHTSDRIWSTGLFGGGTSYEVYVRIFKTQSPTDTITISWHGGGQRTSITESISMTMPVKKNFGFKDFSAWKGQRFALDTTNGYFNTYINRNEKGRGSIFFYDAVIDSVAANDYRGRMSGLFEAKFASFNITRGRFDHSLNEENANYW